MVQLELNKNDGFFYIEVAGKVEAKMTFILENDLKMIINHTEVNDGNHGKGFGKMLVEKAVLFAREKNLKIIPVCSFVKSVFDKTPDYSDVQ
ncbi:GNAT family N-acetyltransferase [Flavobacterium sp.]